MSDPIPRLNAALEGRFEIVREIGAGGMATVYLATQLVPVRREVALKVIEPGQHSDQLLTRFLAERQALALMDHPSIAKVFDAGTTPQGHSWFAMEYVDGEGITDFSDRARLTVDDRLRLFADVCRAVQHAHQKGLIHRDLKPSNILVSMVDGRPMPKVIDFGIAKVEQPEVFGDERLTQVDQVIGTPAYMSPEQLEGSRDVDTTSDIYSLGIILYELLSGALPYEPAAYRGWAALAAARHRDPPLPHQRLSDLADTQETVAVHRRTTPSALRRTLRGDLDLIVSRATEKDRERRYEAASALAADIDRWLASEPVSATAASAAYLLGKFARRHRVAVAGVATTLVALVAGLITTSYFMLEAGAERDRAELEAGKAVAVSDFMQAALLAPGPVEGLGREVTMADALDGAVAELDSAFPGQPQLEAAAASAIGWTFHQMGRYDNAEPLLRRALDIREREPDTTPDDLAESLERWAALPGIDSADAVLRRAVEIRREAVGEDHPSVAGPLIGLGVELGERGLHEDSEGVLRETLRLIEPTGDSLVISHILTQLGAALWNQGELDAVEPIWTDALRLRRTQLGGDHPLVAEALNNLAVLYENLSRVDEAEPLYREALELFRRLLGDDHEEVAAATSNLAMLLDVKGEYAEAEALYLEALRIDRAQLGEGDAVVGHDLVNLGSLQCVWDRPREGLAALEEALRIYDTALEPGHWRAGSALNWRAVCFQALGDMKAAESDFLRALLVTTEALGEDHYRADAIRSRLADLYEGMGRFEEAEPYRR